MSLSLHPSLVGRSLVDVLREGGVVGAGGAGFPTWAKFASPQPFLVVNAQESEPGYLIDKWLHNEHPQQLLNVLAWLRGQGFGKTVIAAKQKDRAWFSRMEQLAGVDTGAARVLDCTGRNRHALGEQPESVLFTYSDDRYAYGMETALLMIVAGQRIPQGERPSQHGFVVVNSETLFNIHELLTTGMPVVDKYVHVYGATPRHTFRRVPVGTPARVVIDDAGMALDDVIARGFVVVDGGPGWFSPVDPLHAVVTRRTNSLLVLDPAVVDVSKKDVFATATKAGYPDPAVPLSTTPSSLSSSSVRLPLIDNPAVKAVSPAVPAVVGGDVVVRGQRIAIAATDGISVDVHASIAGTVLAIGADGIEIG